jgi:hypothetical protein
MRRRFNISNGTEDLAVGEREKRNSAGEGLSLKIRLFRCAARKVREQLLSK